jgi:hypothetical protein
VEPYAEGPRRRDLGVDEPVLAAREQVEVVGGGGAAREQQLAQAHLGRGLHRGRVQAPPHLVQLHQPAEERRLLHPRDVAGEGLRKVVVGVDEPGQGDLAASVHEVLDLHVGGRGPRPHALDLVVLHQHVAVGDARPAIVHGDDHARVVDERAHG